MNTPCPTQIHLLGLGPAGSFLRSLIQPPPQKAVEAALTTLQEVGAITLSTSAAAAAEAGAEAAEADASGLLAPQTDAPATAGIQAQGHSTGSGIGSRGGTSGGAADGAAAAAAPAAEVLTPLGRLLALLPLEPRLGKLLVMGAALGCLAPVLVSEPGT